MLKRFAAPELDDEFAPALGVAHDSCAAVVAPSLPAPRVRPTFAVLAAALGLASMGAVVAKQAVAIVATAPANETAAWALMLVGLAMVGVAFGRHISSELSAAARRSPTSTASRA